MMALTACSSLGLDNDEPEADKDAVNPIRQALASGGSVADADRAIEQKDYQRAYDILRPYLVLNPADDAAKISLAQTYLGRYEGRNAQTILDSLSEDAKDGPKVHMIRGLALLVVGELPEVSAELELALEQDPSLWQAANGLGLLNDFEKRWDEAETSYQRALTIKGDAAAVHNNLGYSYLLQGRIDEATKAFSTSLSHQPDLTVARANLRLALAAKGRYTDAIAGTARKQLPQVLNNIGYVAMVLGDFESADVFFNRAIDESPIYYDTAQENLERLQSLVDKPADQRPVRGVGRSLGN